MGLPVPFNHSFKYVQSPISSAKELQTIDYDNNNNQLIFVGSKHIEKEDETESGGRQNQISESSRMEIRKIINIEESLSPEHNAIDCSKDASKLNHIREEMEEHFSTNQLRIDDNTKNENEKPTELKE
jgi:hypothetical protein